MKLNQHFKTLYILLIIGQLALCNYCQFGPYVMLSMLPAMILCLPTGMSTITGMIVAFCTGMSVDWLSEGLIGLNTAAIVPVALMRKGIIRTFLGEDIIIRGDRFSYRKNGFAKISAANSICLIVFLGLYILFDGAGTLPAAFCFTKGGVSFVCNFVLAIIVTNLLTPEDKK